MRTKHKGEEALVVIEEAKTTDEYDPEQPINSGQDEVDEDIHQEENGESGNEHSATTDENEWDYVVASGEDVLIGEKRKDLMEQMKTILKTILKAILEKTLSSSMTSSAYQ